MICALQAIDYGVIKMNIDTDTQWAYWSGIKEFEAKYHHYLQTQIGNPDGPDKPNKKYDHPSTSLLTSSGTTTTSPLPHHRRLALPQVLRPARADALSRDLDGRAAGPMLR